MKGEPFENPLHTEDFADILERALNGDAIAAKSALAPIASILLPQPMHSGTDEILEVPDYVRAYLSIVISKIACGIDANVAFGLKQSHRSNKYDVSDLKQAAFLMHQLLEQPSTSGKAMTRKEAASAASKAFNEHAKEQAAELEDGGYWPETPQKSVSARAVLDYYSFNESQMKSIHDWLRDNEPESLPPALRARKHRAR
ncbi:MAG: hypothetical protein EKK46_15110 [Rhodocyclaceae bacterium]|nr:MAG: hypothetical protein EKK46_15110 [Rhodocyclaceae bacterium]